MFDFFFRKRGVVARVAAALALAAVTTATTSTALPASAAANEPVAFTPSVRASLDAAVDAATRTGDDRAPGVSVAVVENGAVVYSRAAGFGDLGKRIEATSATRFWAGSVTKMFTAVAVLQLVESGRIKIDEPLASYLPNAPHAKDVTIRQLLTHTSGIPNYADAAISSGAVRKRTTPQGIVDSIASKPLDFVPGHKYGYSNTGYVLLGLTVEAVTQQSLAAYERQNILERAGMTQTGFGAPAATAPVAAGYLDADGHPAALVDPSWLYAAGDVNTTAADLARFDVALMNGKLVAPATLAAMQRNGVEPSADGRSYGLGLELQPFGDARLAGHHGGVPGFEASDELIPAQNFAVVVLGNSFRFDTGRVEMPVLQALLPADYAAYVATERRRESSVAASADPKVTAALRSLVAGFQRGDVDRNLLSKDMNAALTANVIATERTQFSKLGALTALVFRGKSVDGKYDVYEYAGTFAGGAQTVPLRLVYDETGKIAGFFQA